MKNILLFIFLFFTQSVFAQYYENTVSKDSILLSRNSLRVIILSPGISYEKRISRNITLSSDFLVTGFYRKSTLTVNSQSAHIFALYPFLTLGPRFYYNLTKRINSNKSVKANSGNYFSFKITYLGPSFLESRSSNTIISGSIPKANKLGANIVWGLQRTYKRNLYLNLNTGLAISSQYKDGYGVVGNLQLGYSLFSNYN
nr:hypothetical protein [uncultured Arsenicibacter sp.]